MTGLAAGCTRSPARAVGGTGHRRLLRPVDTTLHDWQGVAQVLRRTGAMWGPVFRAAYPRTDLRVVSRGIGVEPDLAVRSYVALTRYPDGKTLLMGDIAVTEEELQPLTDALQAGDLAQTSIHKHLLAHDPALLWTHVHALTDDPVTVAGHLMTALKTTRTPMSPPVPAEIPHDFDAAALDAALGGRGTDYHGIYKFTFIRKETLTDHHRAIPWGMGMVTGVNFQPLGKGRAAVNGALALIADEVQDAISALRRGRIGIVELHNHTLTEEPRIFYVRFWAEGDALGLARATAAAVRCTNVASQATPAYTPAPK
ncbi:LppY/LpqO family protein [Streptomyces griseocarneus]|uniref:LppY/LpqO family protein n=1 Tax=Streptomyces griseocarneus TaxID=51201 RepID=UPI00167CA38D|nr:LppY/LpqO family protein [Streptomyces griseocarneus]MBZ6477986.1 DUF1259 domain-containing protein [Streptomyces griseocarneus]